MLDQLAAERGLALVCVQPRLVYRAREGEGLTRDKSDPKDAMIIARLAAGCTVTSRSARTRCGRGCVTRERAAIS